jgi:uncharacterized tellurite resistance protein B-like protein
MEISRAEREKTVEIYTYAKLINEHYSREDKEKIMEAVWKVIYADQKLDAYEDRMARVIADLLKIRHREMIEIKQRVKNQ